jgi:hypothetical protein
MNETLHDFCQQFWICLAAALVFAALSYVQIWRRHFWLRILDAEESFEMRLGLPKGGFGRRFGESRILPIWSVVLLVLFLVLAALNAYEYFHYLHAPA